ncbi:MAG: hypothetical protein KBS95_08900 [Alistipes sp.]|nr:hypothetical protein [Candidatus Alistipes equi]
MTSAKLHDINLNVYMSFLLEQMSIVEDCVIENEKSKNFELFRNMLPDRYAEMHKNDKKPYYPSPEVDSGPLNPNSKRCGYKKHRVPEPSPNREVG